jgi:hypothetical protein
MNLDNLEYFFDLKLKNETFHPRKLQLPRDRSFILFGARGVGKSSLIIDYLQFKGNKYLYIDAQDPIFVFDDISKDEIEDFIKQEMIETLVIDHFFDGFLEDLPKVRQLILISRDKNSINSKTLDSFELLPLDYEEFLGFERVLTPQIAFNHFLKLGTLPKVAKGSIGDSFMNLRESFLEKFDEMEARLLLIIARFHSRRVSPHHLYTTGKEYFKISKDWTYKTIKKFQKEGVIYYVDEVLSNRVKKIVIYDFALAKYLNKRISFSQTFDSMILLALLKHNFEFLSFSELGYFIVNRSRLISPAPFATKEQSIKIFFSKIHDLKKFGILSVALVSISNRYSFTLDGIKFEAMPFYEWSILNE